MFGDLRLLIGSRKQVIAMVFSSLRIHRTPSRLAGATFTSSGTATSH